MERALYYQHENLSMEPCVLVNGQVLQGLERTKMLEELIRISGKAARHEEPWVGKIMGYYFVKGLLDNNDELGRRMVFVYILSVDEERSQLLQLLMQDLQKQDKQLEKMTKEAIEGYQNGLNAKIVFFVAALLVALLVGLLILSNRQVGRIM